MLVQGLLDAVVFSRYIRVMLFIPVRGIGLLRVVQLAPPRSSLDYILLRAYVKCEVCLCI